MQLAISGPIQARMNPINFFVFFFFNHLLHIAGTPRLPSFFIPIYLVLTIAVMHSTRHQAG